MTDHGLHTVHPSRRMARLCLQYPWSLLWVLLMGLVASLVAGEYTTIVLLLALSTVIFLHSIHQDREKRRRRR